MRRSPAWTPGSNSSWHPSLAWRRPRRLRADRRRALARLASDGTPVLGLVARLDEVTGVGVCNARVFIAELGTDISVFPTPGHAAAWPG